jgi:hypothetical protein
MIFKRIVPRVLYSVLLSAGILSALLAVLAGSFCKTGSTFNFQESFEAPWAFLTRLWMFTVPAWLVVTLVILPFSPKVWTRRSIAVVLGVPIAIYVLLGGWSAIDLYWHPYTGCL